MSGLHRTMTRQTRREERRGQSKPERRGLVLRLISKGPTKDKETCTRRVRRTGVGYRVEKRGTSSPASGRKRVFRVGFSHPVRVTRPIGLNATIDKTGQALDVTGSSRAQVTEGVAALCRVRPRNAYTGAGITVEGAVRPKRKSTKAAGKGGKGK